MTVPVALPVDAHLEEVRARLAEARALVLVAPPGSGKSTRVPPALCAEGPVILLQPRRAAARAVARRIAAEEGWTVGGEVGWQVRFERRFSARTRLLVATEGILTARLRQDPFLSDFTTVVLDEFHERSLHADLALAMAREALRAREDLHLLVMSATLDAEPVAAYLGGVEPCPVLEVPGRVHPVEVEHAPDESVEGAVRRVLGEGEGHLLAFLPGMREIRAVEGALRGSVDAEVHVLHGSLPARAQDRALAPSSRRKVILSTNLAETSLTVEGVTAVVDAGYHRVLRFDPSVELDRLETERISLDSAEQRAGRAGRVGPGRAVRLWDHRLRLRAHREPDVARVDQTGTVLDLMAWGGDPRSLDWFEAPPPAALDHAYEVLALLGAVEGAPPRLTDLGRRLARLPVAPRLARVLVETGSAPEAGRVVALLSEGVRLRDLLPEGGAASTSDLLVMLDHFDRVPAGVRRTAEQLTRAAGLLDPGPGDPSEEGLRRALLAGFPDRVAKRRSAGSPRVLLAGGHGATLARGSTVHDAEWLLALDVRARRGEEALVHVASAVDPGWLAPTSREVEHHLDPTSGAVRARETARYHALLLEERPVPAAPDRARALLVEEMLRRPGDFLPEGLLPRLRFAGVELPLEPLFEAAAFERTALPARLGKEALPYDVRARLAAHAPERLDLPSGRAARLEYREDGAVVAEAKLQELFGLAESPRLGPAGQPVLLSLLAPSGRSVQLTDDLRSFWERTYPEVRKELRGRYPKHPWPEDPWSAEPTHRTRSRRS